MTLLKREIAPILPDAWAAIDNEARRALKLKLAGRKVVDVKGPYGWTLSSVNTGKLQLLDAEPTPGVNVGVRQVQPIVELRTPFELQLMELDSICRGDESPNLDAVAEAADRIARAEDGAIFQGFAAGSIPGLLGSLSAEPIPFGESPEERLAAVVQARRTLQRADVDGPYALVVGEAAHAAILQAADDGYPLVKRLSSLLEGPLIRADVLDGGVLVSLRGGDFELTIGQDISIGYVSSDRHTAELFMASSFTFRVLEPDAAVALS
ncbi:MAG: bacteriocin [Acidobacteria bacterium]|nr:bacteriocin [Acidobacteriota bacterium]